MTDIFSQGQHCEVEVFNEGSGVIVLCFVLCALKKLHVGLN